MPGKDVYLEKPMIHRYSDGPEIIETALKAQRILQVGSQRVSSMIYKEAKQLLQAGSIGEISVINGGGIVTPTTQSWGSMPPFPPMHHPRPLIGNVSWVQLQGNPST